LLSAAPVHAQTIPGLVAAYGFEEGSGTAIGDVSGQNNNGVASGTTWSTAGKFGNALVFNGTNAVVTVPNAASLQLTTAVTLEAWVFPTAAPTGWRAIIDKNVDGYYLFASTDNGNRPGAGGTWTNGNKNVFGTSVLPVNTWTHLASTFDGTTVRLFVNGVQVASLAQTVPLATTTATLQIGGDAYTGENFAGLIDEVRVYNRALSRRPRSRPTWASRGRPGRRPSWTTGRTSAPGALSRHGSGSTKVNLAWGAADRQRRRHWLSRGALRRARVRHVRTDRNADGHELGDTGLTAGTSYSYRVRADRRLQGNLGRLLERRLGYHDGDAGHHAARAPQPALSATAASAYADQSLLDGLRPTTSAVTGYRWSAARETGAPRSRRSSRSPAPPSTTRG
jgi:hypothetical protein